MEGQRHNNPLTRVAFVYNGQETERVHSYNPGARTGCGCAGKTVKSLENTCHT